ncbi:hypothetical protein AJ87_12785 [Rhizobium yanglingense]|nr:hypothetical protein AJ87_12785 [Rhizobium yanglingense]
MGGIGLWRDGQPAPFWMSMAWDRRREHRPFWFSNEPRRLLRSPMAKRSFEPDAPVDPARRARRHGKGSLKREARR